jgi:hypothetical protein
VLRCYAPHNTLVGKDANDICTALDFPIEPLKRIDGMDSLRPLSFTAASPPENGSQVPSVSPTNPLDLGRNRCRHLRNVRRVIAYASINPQRWGVAGCSSACTGPRASTSLFGHDALLRRGVTRRVTA